MAGKTFPELTALSAPVVDSDVVAAYRSPGPAKRTTAAELKSFVLASSTITALEASGAIVGDIAVGSTSAAYLVTPSVGTTAAYARGKLYAFTPDVTNALNPTLKFGTGPALQFTDRDAATMPAGTLPAGRPVIVMYETGFGGYFRLLYADRMPLFRTVESSGTANAIVATSSGAFAPIPAYTTNLVIVVRLSFDVTTAVPTLALDGLTALGIYDSSNNNVDPRLLRQGNYLVLRYSTSFGGLWQVVSPIAPPLWSASAFEGLQRADESASGARSLREELITASVLPTISLNPTPIYDNQFTSSGDVTGIASAKGTGPDSSYTAVDLTWSSADGGYGESSAVATPGATSWWLDWNHVGWGPGMLHLLAIFNSTMNGGALPNRTDLRNCRVSIAYKAVNLYLPAEARLMFHWQGPDLSVANGGTGKRINFQWHEPLDIRLGSLGLGKGAPAHPNTGTGRLINGSGTIDIDFVPNDAYWRCLGSSRDRIDTYAFAPVERVMRAALTSGAASSYDNMQIQIVYPQQWGGAAGPKTGPVDRAYGALRIESFVIKVPV